MEPRIIELMGYRVDLNRITNPSLLKVIGDRRCGNDFMFYRVYSQHSDCKYHVDYNCCDSSHSMGAKEYHK